MARTDTRSMMTRTTSECSCALARVLLAWRSCLTKTNSCGVKEMTHSQHVSCNYLRLITPTSNNHHGPWMQLII